MKCNCIKYILLVLFYSISGGIDSFAVDEKEAFVIGREIIASLNLAEHPRPSQIPQEPLYDQRDLRGLVPSTDGSTVDMYKVGYFFRCNIH